MRSFIASVLLLLPLFIQAIPAIPVPNGGSSSDWPSQGGGGGQQSGSGSGSSSPRGLPVALPLGLPSLSKTLPASSLASSLASPSVADNQPGGGSTNCIAGDTEGSLLTLDCLGAGLLQNTNIPVIPILSPTGEGASLLPVGL